MAALTNKDKKLIYFCSIFAAASLSYMLLISPKMNEMAELENEYMNAYSSAYDISFKLSGYEGSKIYMQETEEDFNKYAVGLCSFTETEEIDEFISRSARLQGLVPQALSVAQEAPAVGMQPYSEIQVSEEEDMSSYIFPESLNIYERECTITVSGTMADIMSFIDLLNSTEGFMVTAVDFSNEDMDAEIPSITAESKKISGMLSFRLYRYDKEGAEEEIREYSESFEEFYIGYDELAEMEE